MSMTFNSLQEDVKRYLERGSTAAQDPVFLAQLPSLINFAERRIAQELKIEGFINAVTGSFTVGQPVIAKPDRWRDTVSWAVGTGTGFHTRRMLYTRAYEYLGMYWPDRTATDTPEFYADYNGTHWLVAPTPDQAYEFEILYYELPQLLSDSVATNWITEYAPQLLLYGTLLESAPFLKNDERMQTWQAMYDRSAATLNGEDIAKILDRAAVRKEA